MAQVAQGFQYVLESKPSGYTALGGLPAFLDLVSLTGLADSLDDHVGIRAGGQGFTDAQVGLAIILLNIAGGTCVDDLESLEADEGFQRLLLKVEHRHLPRWKRREQLRRWRSGERQRAVPAPSSARRWLSCFHDAEEEERRPEAGAFIPAANRFLEGLREVQRELLEFAQLQACEETATLDLDATLVETTKKEARHCYKGFRAYQPLNVWWAEQELVVRSEFRDGNVPAGHDNLRVLSEALRMLPDRVEKVRFRADTASYQWELLRFMEEGKDERFDRIEFAVGCNVSPEFKMAVAKLPEEAWSPLYEYPDAPGEEPRPTHREWAEVDFVPGELQKTKQGRYRFYATRAKLGWPAVESEDEKKGKQERLPFPVLQMELQDYKVHGVVTNLRPEAGWDGEDVIRFLDGRMGRSEKAHDVMKHDLAGGTLPSGKFGVNAAWWQLMILAQNLATLFKRHALGEGWAHKRMKALRFELLHLAGKVQVRGNQLFVRLSKAASKAAEILFEARRKIAALFRPPPTRVAAPT